MFQISCVLTQLVIFLILRMRDRTLQIPLAPRNNYSTLVTDIVVTMVSVTVARRIALEQCYQCVFET